MSEQVPATNNEEVVNFSWWLCMLPFLVAGGICIYKWMGNRADSHWLMYALGAMVIGLIFTAVVAGVGSAPTSNDQDSTTGGAGNDNFK